MASKRSDLRVLERIDQTLNSRVSTECSSDKSTQEKDKIPGIPKKAAFEETTGPSLQAVIASCDATVGGVEALAW